jgi:hypothetical protein
MGFSPGKGNPNISRAPRGAPVRPGAQAPQRGDGPSARAAAFAVAPAGLGRVWTVNPGSSRLRRSAPGLRAVAPAGAGLIARELQTHYTGVKDGAVCLNRRSRLSWRRRGCPHPFFES